MKQTTFINFPNEVNQKSLKASKYLIGDKLTKSKLLNLYLFDVVSYDKTSECQRTGKPVYHAIAYRELEKQTTVLTLIEK